jgi:hypothetical protein
VFTLCAVAQTSFNLPYASLTSHEARQAILNLRSSDPEFYAEITSGVSAPISSELDELAEHGSDSDEMELQVEEDLDIDLIIQQFQAHAIAATGAVSTWEKQAQALSRSISKKIQSQDSQN